jgi:hypothetical protein
VVLRRRLEHCGFKARTLPQRHTAPACAGVQRGSPHRHHALMQAVGFVGARVRGTALGESEIIVARFHRQF